MIMENEILAAAAAAAAVGTFRATASRSLACAAVQHVWALYRRPVAHRLDALDDPAETETQDASPDDPFWGVAGTAKSEDSSLQKGFVKQEIPLKCWSGVRWSSLLERRALEFPEPGPEPGPPELLKLQDNAAAKALEQSIHEQLAENSRSDAENSRRESVISQSTVLHQIHHAEAPHHAGSPRVFELPRPPENAEDDCGSAGSSHQEAESPPRAEPHHAGAPQHAGAPHQCAGSPHHAGAPHHGFEMASFFNLPRPPDDLDATHREVAEPHKAAAPHHAGPLHHCAESPQRALHRCAEAHHAGSPDHVYELPRLPETFFWRT